MQKIQLLLSKTVVFGWQKSNNPTIQLFSEVFGRSQIQLSWPWSSSQRLPKIVGVLECWISAIPKTWFCSIKIWFFTAIARFSLKKIGFTKPNHYFSQKHIVLLNKSWIVHGNHWQMLDLLSKTNVFKKKSLFYLGKSWISNGNHWKN